MRARRGFTLLEMMVAVVIGALSVVMAAQVAQTVIRQNAKGKQRNDFSSRARLLGRQLRSDLKMAGIGATGAVAVDTGFPPFNQMAFQTASNFWAIPVIAGANNLPAAAGGLTLTAGSDAIQIVVPNPALLARTMDRAPLGINVITFAGLPGEDASVLANCAMVYISDHSSPTGAGRSQVAFLSSANATQVILNGNLQFTVAPGSDVMCARVSTYWVDGDSILRRSDVVSGGAVVQPDGNTPLFIPVGTPNDVVSPGVLDMQVAYRMSSEIYRLANQAVPGAPEAQWAFTATGPNASGYMTTDSNWFEVRMVRISILGRTMRRIESGTSARNYARVEDASALPAIPVNWNYTAEWISASETITNLRYFDYGAPERIPVEPF